jgi:hypothetical protein
MLQNQLIQAQHILAERRRKKCRKPHFLHKECFSLLKGWRLTSPSSMGASVAAAGVSAEAVGVAAGVHEK